MFGLMKNLLKEKPPVMQAVGFGELHVGCRVGFGFMPQKILSGRRLQVTETNSYIFDGDNFLAYRLEDEDTEINLIVAGEGETGYLALSLPLQEKLYEPLFDSLTPGTWFGLKDGHTIEIAPHVLGAPRGWLAPKYTLAVKTKGRMLEGDFRMRKPEGRLSLSLPFDYALFVDFANNYALEAERYEDGHIHVYATVYRPQTDIGEMVRPARLEAMQPHYASEKTPRKEASMPVLEASVESETAAEESPVSILHNDAVIPEISSNDNVQPEAVEPSVMSIQQANALAHAAEVAPMHGKFGRIPVASVQSDNTIDTSEMLACELKLAGRIIDEALRNQMPMAELIRKVIDLPVKSKDEVLIPFELDPPEYAELARRYDLQANDYEGVRQQIIQDLKNFAGIKG